MPRSAPRFEIWEAGSRIHSVDNPVRLKVLRALEARPRKLPELVRITGKAKSTLSELHVGPLVEAGLVAEHADPKDSRSKLYELRGHRLGSSDVDVPRLRASVLAYASRAGVSGPAALLRVVDPVALVAVDEPDYVDAVAERLGRSIGEGFKGLTREKAVEALDQELRQARCGGIRIEKGEPKSDARPPALARFAERVARNALASSAP